jgi:hypothetical protein
MSLDWLTADFSVFGFHIQHWMPVVALVFAVFIVSLFSTSENSANRTERAFPMQYFDQSADKYERLGKVIGDTISAIIVVGFMAIFVYGFISR